MFDILTCYECEVSQVLQFDSSFCPNPLMGFFDMGMDSLMSVELKNQLEKMVGTSLPATLTFEYSTIEALAEYLLEKVIAQDEELNPESESPSEEEPAEDLVNEIVQLSEEQLTALVDRELEELLRV